MKIKGIIFDVDGTLLDSMWFWNEVGERYLNTLGKTSHENLSEIFKEMSLEESALYYQKNYQVKKSIEEIIFGVNQVMIAFYKEEVQLKPYVKEVLDLCYKNNIKMCIATSSTKDLIQHAFKRLNILHYFSEIYTCSEIGKGKSDPLIYETCLSQMHLKKEEVLVFEDAYHALSTAKNAGFKCVGIFDPSENKQEEIQSIADYYIKDFKKVEEIVNENSFNHCR